MQHKGFPSLKTIGRHLLNVMSKMFVMFNSRDDVIYPIYLVMENGKSNVLVKIVRFKLNEHAYDIYANAIVV